jgi:hypothetical protein
MAFWEAIWAELHMALREPPFSDAPVFVLINNLWWPC